MGRPEGRHLSTTDDWSSAVERELASGGLLWRAHSDAVNSALVHGWIPRRPSLRILKTDLYDEAVGAGLYPLLRDLSEHVVAADVSEGVVAAARRRYPGLDAVVADVRELPFDDAAFDVIVSNSTLDHFGSVDDLHAGLAELRRVLTPGGELLVTLDNAANPVVALRNHLPLAVLRRLGLVPYFVGATCGPRRLRALLVAVGFTAHETRAVMHCPRLPAILVGRFLGRGQATHDRYLAWLERFELLERLPTRNLTGYFVAVRASRA